MKYKHIFNLTFLSKLSGLMLITSTMTWAGDSSGNESLVLRTIMQNMSNNMQKMTDAISCEDWDSIVETAPLIADHPQPPLGEKISIISHFGFQISEFKEFDAQTHNAAKTLEQIAQTKDGNAIIEQFAVLQKSCLACHQRFRKPFTEHFYGQQ